MQDDPSTPKAAADRRPWDGPGIPGLTDYEVIGAGSAAIVYRARQASVSRMVAVKLLTADLVDPAARRRFDRECELLGQLGSHHQIIDIYDAGVADDGRPFIVMPFYPAGSLVELLDERRTLPAHEVVDLVADVASALQTAHDRDVVHRDIKPQNLLVDAHGDLVLADFGISAATGNDAAATTLWAYTEAYAAPELLDRNAYSPASDIYSLAATAYTMLTGHAPFHTLTGTARRRAVRAGAPARIDGVSRQLNDVLAAALSPQPQDRPGSAAEFADALRAAIDDPGATRVVAGPMQEATVRAAAHRVDPTRVAPRTRFCTSCGAALTVADGFCQACGTPAATSLPAPPAAPASTPAAAPHPPARSGRGTAVLVAVPLAVLALAGTALAVQTAGRPTVAPSAPASPSPVPTVTVTAEPEPAAPRPRSTVTVTAEPEANVAPPVGMASLDPCDGGPFPFDYALSLAPAAPPAGSDLGVAVANVQSILRSLGYTGLSGTNPVAADGWYGKHTVYAVRTFQRDWGIEPVGTVYDQTWAALGDAC